MNASSGPKELASTKNALEQHVLAPTTTRRAIQSETKSQISHHLRLAHVCCQQKLWALDRRKRFLLQDGEGEGEGLKVHPKIRSVACRLERGDFYF
ncbi:hypothetical protein CDAR_95991 [Caerostris darwini]|uniref:Uncharacterized protein n=1 Tax=Caerostris darwini TaxID=1538125 RepID=A0AAV4UQ72_9ARAC|nr:hypothetical protein CDAR_95991 [Caerostris darwini]